MDDWGSLPQYKVAEDEVNYKWWGSDWAEIALYYDLLFPFRFSRLQIGNMNWLKIGPWFGFYMLVIEVVVIYKKYMFI